MDKFLIFNADDFGASTGINRGIVECHQNGVVTSTSIMVSGKAVVEAVAMSRDNPNLSIGLHFDVWGEDEREFDINDHVAVREEFRIQLAEFHRLFGRGPTHVDSHRHAHRRPGMMPVFEELVSPLGVPLRDSGPIKFVGGFYAQWEWMVTELRYVGVPHLIQMLREEVEPGWTEFSCHPGYALPDFQSIYLGEREEEVRTLTNTAIKTAIEENGIRLANYSQFPISVGHLPIGRNR